MNLSWFTGTWIEAVLGDHYPVLLGFRFDDHRPDVLRSLLKVLVRVVKDPWLTEHMGQQALLTVDTKTTQHRLLHGVCGILW